MPGDKKALQILFDAFWSSAGWKRDNTIPPADFEYARQTGRVIPKLKRMA